MTEQESKRRLDQEGIQKKTTNKNVRIAKRLVKIAECLVALDEEGDGSGVQVFHDMDNAGFSDEARLDFES